MVIHMQVLYTIKSNQYRELALHWRYDRRDFLSISRCAKFSRIIRDTSLLTYQMACHLFLPIFARPAGFAEDIVRVLSERGLKRIYIAAPPSEKVFMDDLMGALKRRGVEVLTYQHVAEFFEANYANCQHFKVKPLTPNSSVKNNIGSS